MGICESVLKLAAASANPRNLSLASLSAILLSAFYLSAILLSTFWLMFRSPGHLSAIADQPLVGSYASDSVVSALPPCCVVIGRYQGVERCHWLALLNSKVHLWTTSHNTKNVSGDHDHD